MQNFTKNILSLIVVLAISGLAIFSSCKKDDTKEMEYVSYDVDYLLTNKLNNEKRFNVRYYNPAFANNTVIQELVRDTLWIRGIKAKSLDMLFVSGESLNDTSDFLVSVFVDSKLIVSDSAACSWRCDTIASIEYALP